MSIFLQTQTIKLGSLEIEITGEYGRRCVSDAAIYTQSVKNPHIHFRTDITKEIIALFALQDDDLDALLENAERAGKIAI